MKFYVLLSMFVFINVKVFATGPGFNFIEDKHNRPETISPGPVSLAHEKRKALEYTFVNEKTDVDANASTNASNQKANSHKIAAKYASEGLPTFQASFEDKKTKIDSTLDTEDSDGDKDYIFNVGGSMKIGSFSGGVIYEQQNSSSYTNNATAKNNISQSNANIAFGLDVSSKTTFGGGVFLKNYNTKNNETEIDYKSYYFGAGFEFTKELSMELTASFQPRKYVENLATSTSLSISKESSLFYNLLYQANPYELSLFALYVNYKSYSGSDKGSALLFGFSPEITFLENWYIAPELYYAKGSNTNSSFTTINANVESKSSTAHSALKAGWRNEKIDVYLGYGATTEKTDYNVAESDKSKSKEITLSALAKF